ncbi:amidase [Methylobacterium aquaticum]|jgi:amidase|uniref:Indoleacetamide hydrolase n=1 Tax=Methylobacterium aquaticum TaxID=270351 RepID=A0A0J6S834_9HYPH|nr:amidase [Methylobacterium aquaticum]KMO29528.1 glutamyl-tRNA amidotransferase [Methylobacterium aquaticum]
MTIFAQRLDLGGAGPRVAVKDTIDIAGIPTRAGSRALADAPPASTHAEVVERVLAAGCRIVGKTNLHELAFGVTGLNDWTGTAPNPLFPGRVPGGSSSGSAAVVAAGEADFALGTDTGGSIRIPAACCGVFGMKPTFGRVSRAGVAPAQTTLDCVGPFAATMPWLVRAMAVIDPRFAPVSLPAPRIGLVTVEARPEIAAAVERAVAAAGLAAHSTTLPGLSAAFEAGLTVINAETFAAFGHLLARSPGEPEMIGPDVAGRLRAGAGTSLTALAAAEAVRAAFRAEVDARLDEADVLVLPTLPDLPPTLAEARGDRSAVFLTTLVRPFNLSGHPALSLPLPLGPGRVAALQVIGRRGGDETVLAVGERIAECLCPPARDLCL